MIDKLTAQKVIASLETTDEVSYVYRLLKERRQAIQSVAAMHLRMKIGPGHRVRTSASAKPEYAANQPGTVKHINSKTALVEFDNVIGRFGREARVPLTMIEILLEGDGGR